jgi:large subunit ribosomal protein L9
MSALELSIQTKAGDNGKIFGSINTIQLAAALKKEGYEVDRKSLKIKDEPIKELGSYEAEVNLYKGVQQTISFKVIEE